MNVIITGATGFIGRNIAESFFADGIQVLATGRSLEAGLPLREKGINYRIADILNVERLSQAFAPVDCVIHCAGKPGDWGNYQDFYQANVVGTQNVMRACEKHGVQKIIFVSTPSIYFNGQDRLNISESDPLPRKQVTHYAKTKLEAENDLLRFSEKGNKVIIFRPRAVYGPYDNTIVSRILRLAERRRFPLIGGGEAQTDITYIDNFVDAVRTCLTAEDDKWNNTYNISNGSPIRIRDWFAEVLGIFGKSFNPRNVPEGSAAFLASIMESAARLPFGPQKPSFTRFSVAYMAKSMTMSIVKAADNLGYEPRIGNTEGFERFAEWYRSSGASNS